MLPWEEQLQKIQPIKAKIAKALQEAREPITEQRLDTILFNSDDPVTELARLAMVNGLAVEEVLKRAERRLTALQNDANAAIRNYNYNQQRKATRAATH
ncbi:MAG: hypothetical protein KDJ52_15515 [Anaerolineae bacterium]|nr:hypothetical protein [Anaerolineae bacterium]